MKKIIISLFAITSLSSFAMNCSKGSVNLEVNNNEIIIRNGNDEIRKIVNDSVWDGHIGGIITGRGFSISYQNHYGCFRFVNYTGPISSHNRNIVNIDFGTCAGGSTPDGLCLRR